MTINEDSQHDLAKRMFLQRITDGIVASNSSHMQLGREQFSSARDPQLSAVDGTDGFTIDFQMNQIERKIDGVESFWGVSANTRQFQIEVTVKEIDPVFLVFTQYTVSNDLEENKLTIQSQWPHTADMDGVLKDLINKLAEDAPDFPIPTGTTFGPYRDWIQSESTKSIVLSFPKPLLHKHFMQVVNALDSGLIFDANKRPVKYK